MLGWAEANGVPTPGGVVVPSSRFWDGLDACGVGDQARYLERAALRLDPRHSLDIARSIRKSLGHDGRLEALARPIADAAFEQVGGGVVVCRSSAAMEDGRTAAFPGVFVSVLDVTSPGRC